MSVLLKLPAPPPLASAKTITSFYRRPITQAIASSSSSLLYIAITAPFSTSHRRKTFSAADRIFAAVYALVYRLTEKHAPTLDVRVVLISDVPGGPVVDETVLLALAQWDAVLAPALEPIDVEEEPYSVVADAALEHARVAVGGTFDHLHAGHKLLLTMTTYLPSPTAEEVYVVIGVTGEEMLREKKFAEFLEPWKVRVDRTLAFIRGITEAGYPSGGVVEDKEGGILASVAGGKWKVFFADLRDPCGPTITDPTITALVLTEETANGGEYVNKMRRERGMNELDIVSVELVTANESALGKLSSTDLRRRDSERAGKI